MTTWHDIETARDEWVDAPLDDDALTTLLAVAKQQVLAYAPTLPAVDPPVEPEEIPDNYRYGQLEQAKNLWNAGRVDAGGGVGDDTFVVRPHPLDWIIKQILRPRRAVPRVR
ncbi:MAG: hypothetical protein WED09_11945 [Homoserinimonas sp.]